MHLDTITKLLDISNHKAAVAIMTEDRIYVILERIEDTPPVCSGCGKVHGTSVHSKDAVVIEDLRIIGKRIFLCVPRRKVKCIEDGTVRVEEISWIKGRFTDLFAHQVYRLTSITTNQEAGWYLGLDDETVYRVDKGVLEELVLERLDPVPVPKQMSVDEVAWQKWHKYVTNVGDID